MIYFEEMKKINKKILLLILFLGWILVFHIQASYKTSEFPKSQFDLDGLVSYIKYNGSECWVIDFEGNSIGAPMNDIEINYYFNTNSSGTFMQNEIIIKHPYEQTIEYSKLITFRFNFTSNMVFYENGTVFGKIHLFLPSEDLREDEKILLLASYNGTDTYGYVEYDNFPQYILDETYVVESSGFRVTFQEDGADHLMIFETKSGILIQFNPNFLNLDIFDLFGIQWASGDPILIDDTDFIFEQVEIPPRPKNFWSQEFIIILLSAATFVGLFILVRKKRDIYFKSKTKGKSKNRKK